MTRLGFIGLGVMGNSIVKHLLGAGHSVAVFTRTKAKAQEVLELGATWAASPLEVAKMADIVFTMVGYPHDVENVYFGEDGLFAASKAGHIFVDMTTSTPTLAVRIAQAGQERGVATLDAPVSGGDLGARKGQLSAMVGGERTTYEKVLPYLGNFCSRVHLHGDAGAGQHTKMANQIMIAGTMTGMIEMLVYAQAAGLETADVIETVGAGSASNWSLVNYAPRILKQDYSPGFFAKHFLKDLKIALDEAERLGIDLPSTQLAAQLYERLCANGYENDGTQALIKLWWRE